MQELGFQDDIGRAIADIVHSSLNLKLCHFYHQGRSYIFVAGGPGCRWHGDLQQGSGVGGLGAEPPEAKFKL